MTYTLKLTPHLAALLSAAALNAGLNLPATLATHITGRAGEQPTTEPGSTAPAPVARLTAPAPTPAINLSRPGDILTADPTTDWTDPALYA